MQMEMNFSLSVGLKKATNGNIYSLISHAYSKKIVICFPFLKHSVEKKSCFFQNKRLFKDCIQQLPNFKKKAS